jgi:hypothetical protein
MSSDVLVRISDELNGLVGERVGSDWRDAERFDESVVEVGTRTCGRKGVKRRGVDLRVT